MLFQLSPESQLEMGALPPGILAIRACDRLEAAISDYLAALADSLPTTHDALNAVLSAFADLQSAHNARIPHSSSLLHSYQYRITKLSLTTSAHKKHPSTTTTNYTTTVSMHASPTVRPFSI